MFPDPKPKAKLEIAIDNVLEEMSHHSTTTEEYGKLLERLTALHKLREKPQRPSPDVVIQSTTYIFGIAMILRHEEFNIITTKALGFLPRIR
jgi:hypothetical protein